MMKRCECGRGRELGRVVQSEYTYSRSYSSPRTYDQGRSGTGYRREAGCVLRRGREKGAGSTVTYGTTLWRHLLPADMEDSDVWNRPRVAHLRHSGYRQVR